MKINRLETLHFRNLEPFVFEADSGINVIFGNNAQGKTNLMEALWLFTGNRSFRGARETDLISFGEKSAKLTTEFFCSNREQSAQIMLGERKKHFLNQVPVKQLSAFTGRYYAVVFSPSDLSFVKDGPEKRRRFLDVAISQLKPVYRDYLDQYNRVLAQRNALLKDLFIESSLADTLDLWDFQLAKLGTILTSFRLDYLKKLNRFSGRIFQGISKGQEEVNFTYQSTIFADDEETFVDYNDMVVTRYANAMKEKREDDQKMGFTSVGIHRDDIDISINGISARQFGSQGQQRSCVLTLKLAESELLFHVTGEKPVMLLDDVMSELDADRQDYILNHLEDQQVFITCCDISNTLRLKSGSIYKMENGFLTKQS